MANIFVPYGDALTTESGKRWTPKWREWVRQVSGILQGIVDGALVASDFDAAVFTASGGGTWVTTEPDTAIAAFQSGLMVTLSIEVLNATVTGAPTELRLTLPNDDIAARTMTGLVYLNDNGVPTTGVATVTEDSAVLVITRLDGAALTNSVTATDVRGTVTVEVQP